MQFVEGSYVVVCYLASKTERYSKTDYHRFGWKKARVCLSCCTVTQSVPVMLSGS